MGRVLRWAARSAVGAVGVVLALTMAAPAHADVPGMGRGPHALTFEPAIVGVGEPTWLTVWWATTRRVCDFRLTVAGRGVRILYPSNTATHTSFYRGGRLAPRQTDYTAFRVTADSAGERMLWLRAEYTVPERPNGHCDGVRAHQTTVLPLTVTR
jgi:hypothetical protein